MDSREKRLLVCFTLPASIFLAFVVSIFFLILTGYAILIGCSLAVGTLGKRNFFARYNRNLILMLLVLFLLYPNVFLWPSQIERRLPGGRQALIEPEHEIMGDLNASFQDWHFEGYGQNFSEVNDFETEVYRLYYFIRFVKMEYKFDLTSPYVLQDHLPTISEIIQSDFNGNGRWEDDCDGISILTVSFLIYMGYTNAYISEIEFHWHPIVYQEGLDPRNPEEYGLGIFLYAQHHNASYYMFNQTDLFIPGHQTLWDGIGDIITGSYIPRHLGYLVFAPRYVELPISIWTILLGVTAILVSFLFCFFLMPFNRFWPSNKRFMFKGLAFSAIILFGIVAVCLWVIYLQNYAPHVDLRWNLVRGVNMTLFLGLGASLRVLDFYKKK